MKHPVPRTVATGVRPAWGRGIAWASAVAGLVALALGGCGGGDGATAPSTTVRASRAPSRTTTTSVESDERAMLRQAGVQQSDVSEGFSVVTFEGGDGLDQPTLDVCGASFPSESLRAARHQVLVTDPANQTVMSTEAVLYRDANATAQAFEELRTARANCPTTFVDAGGGLPPTRYEFNPPPDGGWGSVPGVERLAFDAMVSDPQGHSEHSFWVYLRLGRLLVGVYGPLPVDQATTVRGVSGLEGIVREISSRMSEVSTD
jgi:hypothetical protein